MAHKKTSLPLKRIGYAHKKSEKRSQFDNEVSGKIICAIKCTEFVRIDETFCALNCTNKNPDIEAPLSVHALVNNSLSEATKRAYKADIDHYKASGGIIPSTPQMIAEYLALLARTHKPATINRRIASLSKAHEVLGGDNPTKTEIVRATLRGIRRLKHCAQQEAKPLLKEDLFAILEGIGSRPKDIRDKALLLLGFAGAFRRSELVGLNLEDIEHVREGIIITLRKSKTDQTGQGRKVGIPLGRTRWCPVKHLNAWLELAGVNEGSLFNCINRHGHISNKRLSGEAVSVVLKKRAKDAGFEPTGYSGHSLRAGLVTSAAMAGVSTWKIKAQTGHSSDAMLQRYIRDGSLFENNAAGQVL